MSGRGGGRRYQWPGCGAGAEAHVQYDYEDRGVVHSRERDPDTEFMVLHADLCRRHLGELAGRRGRVREMWPGRCDDDCPTNGPPLG